MPTVDLPAMRSIRVLSGFSARHRSSVRLVMRLYLMPASGLNSKVVTTGPGLICVTWPCTSNSAYFSVSTWASSFNSSASIACCSSGRCSKLLGGSLKPPAARSEEHTSELQSHLNLVCRLLLEKKKKNTRYIHYESPAYWSQL